MRDRRGTHRVFVEESSGKEPIGKPRRGWEDNINMDPQEVSWGGIDQIDLAQDRNRRRALVSTIMNILVPQNAGNFLTS